MSTKLRLQSPFSLTRAVPALALVCVACGGPAMDDSTSAESSSNTGSYLRLYDLSHGLQTQLEPQALQAFREDLQRLGDSKRLEAFDRTYDASNGKLRPEAQPSSAQPSPGNGLGRITQAEYYTAPALFAVVGKPKSISCSGWIFRTCTDPNYQGPYRWTAMDGTMNGLSSLWMTAIDFQAAPNPSGHETQHIDVEVMKDYGGYLRVYDGSMVTSGAFIPHDKGKIVSLYMKNLRPAQPYYSFFNARTNGVDHWVYPDQAGGDGVSQWSTGIDELQIYVYFTDVRP